MALLPVYRARVRPAAAPGGDGAPGLVHKVWCGGVDRAWACGQKSRGAWHASYSSLPPRAAAVRTLQLQWQRRRGWPGRATGRVYVGCTDSLVQCCCVIGWHKRLRRGSSHCCVVGFTCHCSCRSMDRSITRPCTALHGRLFFSEVTLIIRPFVKRKAKIKKKNFCACMFCHAHRRGARARGLGVRV
jgi:hypothetical protein